MSDRRHCGAAPRSRMVRRGLRIDRIDEVVGRSVAARLVGGEHGGRPSLPTYVTPIVVLRAELIDGTGRAIPGTREEHRIGREVTLDLERELADTRLRPGERAELPYERALPDGAEAARFSVLVYPGRGSTPRSSRRCCGRARAAGRTTSAPPRRHAAVGVHALRVRQSSAISAMRPSSPELESGHSESGGAGFVLHPRRGRRWCSKCKPPGSKLRTSFLSGAHPRPSRARRTRPPRKAVAWGWARRRCS